jgi:hypothetical protein
VLGAVGRCIDVRHSDGGRKLRRLVERRHPAIKNSFGSSEPSPCSLPPGLGEVDEYTFSGV